MSLICEVDGNLYVASLPAISTLHYSTITVEECSADLNVYILCISRHDIATINLMRHAYSAFIQPSQTWVVIRI